MLGVDLRPSLCLALGALLLSAPTLAGTIDVEWGRVDDAAGYRVYFGTSSRQYTGSVDGGNACQQDANDPTKGVCRATVRGLADCTTWFLAVKAYNSTGDESADFSNEISGWPAPRIDGLSIASVEQGTTGTMEVQGANFQPGSSVAFIPPSGMSVACGGDGTTPLQARVNPSMDTVRASSVNMVGCDGQCVCRLRFDVQAANAGEGQLAAEAGAWDVMVLDPPGPDDLSVFGKKAQSFDVTVDPLAFDVSTIDEATDGVKRLSTADTEYLLGSYASFLVNPNYCDRDSRYREYLDLDGNGVIDMADLCHVYCLGVTDLLETCWNGTRWSVDACLAR